MQIHAGAALLNARLDQSEASMQSMADASIPEGRGGNLSASDVTSLAKVGRFNLNPSVWSLDRCLEAV